MSNWLIRVAVATTLLAIVSPLSTRAVTNDQSDTAVGLQLRGMWRLVGWTQRSTDGTTRPGVTDAGYLIYTDVDRMCAVMMDSKRQRWPAGAPATVDEAVRRLSGFVSYCARVEVNAKEGFVLHHVDVERSPNVVGTVRKRWFRFEGPNRLVLRIDAAELGANLADSTLVWERVEK